MSIDAQHWVWNHSRTRGNPRLVLLAVADAVRTPDCIVRMGTTELRRRLNAPRSVVVNAVDKALASGELVMVEGAQGTRAAAYQLPAAVGYRRPGPGATGPDSGPVAVSQGSGIETPSDSEGSGIRTGSEDARGPDSGPGGSGIETPRGPDSGPHHQSSFTRRASKQDGPSAAPDLGPGIPGFARPLVDTISRAGHQDLRWNLTTAEWFTVQALIDTRGVPALAAYAVKQASARSISFARYFLAGWRDIPPLPAAGAVPPGVIDLTAARPVGRAARAADLYRAALGGDT